MTRTDLRALVVSLAIGFGFGLGSSACVLPNPNHCQNLAVDPNLWCSTYYGEERPYCSPCTADNNGCVSEEPSEDECPAYTPSLDTETDTGETAETETVTGDETETETGAETETETG